MRFLSAALLILTLSGCHSIERMIHRPNTPGPAAAPDDYTIQGTVARGQTWVQPVRCADSQVIVKVLRPGETEWDTANAYEVHLDTKGTGGGGVEFGYICTPHFDSSGDLVSLTLTGKPFAPAGTQYEIRSIRTGAGSEALY